MAATDPAVRRISASIAANVRWSKQNGHDGTVAARQGFLKKFEREVDPESLLPVDERERRARAAMRAHMQRLRLKARAA